MKRKLVLLAAALAGAHAFGEYKDEKKPLAVTIHGAGFRSVLEGAAVARALGDKIAEVRTPRSGPPKASPQSWAAASRRTPSGSSTARSPRTRQTAWSPS